ncbi:hypothetical protein PHLCEN_2v9953, partial [Hermanssonia centrifuga]
SATITLTQTFWQCSPLIKSCARYVFPVPARAAVCGFEMHTEDGRSITAVAKEREAARREYEQAFQQGKMTGLVEHVTDDVFTISLGSLSSLQMVTTKLTYVLDLMDDDLPDQVRFQLPLCVGMRHGAVPAGMQGAKTIPPERISISAEIYMKGAIESITSPSHSTLNVLSDGSIHVGPYVHTRTAEYRSSEFLSQDFILSVRAEGLDAPRCFAQRGPDGSIAMQLTVVPKFNLPTVSNQEYIFLVDRSCSMKGDRIETAKRTLVMLLRSLPRQGTSFNIFSFGYHCDSLWQKSMQYDASTLEIATRYIDDMKADYGGTRIQFALNQVFNSRLSSSPTAVFVLTDGEAYDINATINSVTQAVANAKKGADLRIFTLGIGETTSTAMCEGIARAGNGLCLMAATSETIIGKCSKLVKASRAEILKDVSVDWRAPEQLVVPKDNVDAQNISFHQGPSELSSLYAGNRFLVFAIIKHERFEMPREVVICAHRTSGEELKFTVAVEELSSTTGPSEPQLPLIHTLAARRIITDLEDGSRVDIPLRTKAVIVHLGEQYQLASQYTSFVAVDERSQQPLSSLGDDILSPEFRDNSLSADIQGEVRAFFALTDSTASSVAEEGPTSRPMRCLQKFYLLSDHIPGSADSSPSSPIHSTYSLTVPQTSNVTATRNIIMIPLSAGSQAVQPIRQPQSFDESLPTSTMLAQGAGRRALDRGDGQVGLPPQVDRTPGVGSNSVGLGVITRGRNPPRPPFPLTSGNLTSSGEALIPSSPQELSDKSHGSSLSTDLRRVGRFSAGMAFVLSQPRDISTTSGTPTSLLRTRSQRVGSRYSIHLHSNNLSPPDPGSPLSSSRLSFTNNPVPHASSSTTATTDIVLETPRTAGAQAQSIRQPQSFNGSFPINTTQPFSTTSGTPRYQHRTRSHRVWSRDSIPLHLNNLSPPEPGSPLSSSLLSFTSDPVPHTSSSTTATTDIVFGIPRSAEDQIVRLIRLQSFDGSFPPNTMLAQIVSHKALEERQQLGVDAVVWATVLAMAYLQRYMEKQPDLLEGLLEKANEFLNQQPGVNLTILLAMAQSLIPSGNPIEAQQSHSYCPVYILPLPPVATE